jgi:uncharacterized protein
MNTKEKLEADLKTAMKSSDDLRKRTLRMVLSAIRLSEIDKGQAMDETQVLAVIQKEIKSRQETIAEAQRAKRPDLEAASLDEIAVLEGYLPKQLTSAELDLLASQAIGEVGAVSLKETGQVMKVLLPRLQGRASGDQASAAVRKLLAG